MKKLKNDTFMDEKYGQITKERLSCIPEWDDYFLTIAFAVAQRANCGRGDYPIGAVIIKDSRIVSTGYNGTPSGSLDCLRGGCYFCMKYKTTKDKDGKRDQCSCLHAEQNAIVSAARFNGGLEGALIYCTVEPCIGCLKELRQVKIKGVRYHFKYGSTHYEGRVLNNFESLKAQFESGVKQLQLPPLKLKSKYKNAYKK